jgi:nicotinamidase-related amidase
MKPSPQDVRTNADRELERLGIMRRPPLDPAKLAVVVVDMVNWQVPRQANDGMATPYYVQRLSSVVIPNHRRLLAAARRHGARVVFLRVGSQRADFSDATKPLRQAFSTYGAVDGTFACDVIGELLVQADDLSLIKPGSGGFTTTALDAHLRGMGIEQLVYTGVVTDGCVMLTLAAGFDLGYSGYLVEDATAAFTPERHQLAITWARSSFAGLLSTDDFIDAIEQEP